MHDTTRLGRFRKLLFACTLCLLSVANLAGAAQMLAGATAEAMLSWRRDVGGAPADAGERARVQRALLDRLEAQCPLAWDWMLQDYGPDAGEWFFAGGSTETERTMIANALKGLKDPSGHQKRLHALQAQSTPADDPAWLTLYFETCTARRKERLASLAAECGRIVFVKHYNLGGSHYAYTEGQSDAQAERHFVPGTALCLLEIGADGESTVRTLVEDPRGVIRDPDVSYDGKRILFSWKKSDRQDDYHLYEMDAESGDIRQLTFGLGFADYEGVYLPTGDIVFNSTRCVQVVDCWWTEVSNLYTCDGDGTYLRRLTFDQVHTNYPQVLEDGRVIYTRWDYNDRGQLFPQPLFQMNPDGTGQTEFYGNNSWFPTTILHARGIPGSQKLMAIATGHHSIQVGKLILVDPSKGRQEAQGVQLIAPVRDTEAVRIDQYGQDGDLFAYPWPLDEKACIASLYPDSNRMEREHFHPYRFKLYYVEADGTREMLTWDAETSCHQPVALAERKRPHVVPSRVDYTQETGTYYVQDIYAGPGLAGVERGTVEKLRVVELRFRPAGIGSNGSDGPAGGALASTPVAIDNASWDVKVVLGETPVHKDGSACFTVPARTPVYFQAVDGKGRVVQSMRSWSTLQPGETFSCVGCHESKNEPPATRAKPTLAMQAGPQPLEPFYGEPRGFSFPREIQPILDRHCIGCHDGKSNEEGKVVFSLLSRTTLDERAKRRWSDAYLALTKQGRPNDMVNWLNVQSVPTMLPPYHAGSAKSGLMDKLEKGHGDTKLSREELDKIACWIDLLVPYCGDYAEANAWTQDEVNFYNHFVAKRASVERIERENIQQMLEDQRENPWEAGPQTQSAQRVRLEGKAGWRLPCVFAGNNAQRAYWDRDWDMDLTMARGVEFEFRCDEPSAVGYFTFYLRSGGGWYAATFDAQAPGTWNRVRIDKSETRIEGKPAGWSKVDRVRVSPWRGGDANTDCYIRAVRPYGTDSDVVVLRNDAAVEASPSEARAIQNYCETMAGMLGEMGVPYVVVSDADVRFERLKGRPVVALPYNPAMPKEATEALRRYVEDGGRVLACYVLPEAIQQAVGIDLTAHVKAKEPGWFGSIRPAGEGLAGMPAETEQDSWNIHQAEPTGENARVAAKWYSKDGEDTEMPAVVVSSNAAVLTHVMIGGDAANKRQLLLAMLGHLKPSIRHEAVRRIVDGAGSFGPYADAEPAIAGIEPIARGSEKATAALSAAKEDLQAARVALQRQDYEEATQAAGRAHAGLLRAFCLAQAPLPGEHRAFWCHSAFGIEGRSWDETIRGLAENGFTAILPNMLWGGAAFYPSEVLPTAKAAQQRGDQIAECLAACKKHGVECHVWKVNFNMGWATQRDYVQEMHQSGRTQVNFDGEPQERWLCPSHPANQQLEIDAMLEIARTYDVDGLHFDYIRYPGPDNCFCPGCKERFEAYVGEAISDWPRAVRRDERLEGFWNRFRQEQINRVVEAVATEARNIRPGIEISAAVFRTWPVDRIGVGQDWKLWCEKGWLDFVCPMDYTSSNGRFETMVSQQVEWAGDVPCYPGIGLSTWPDRTDVAGVIEQIGITREYGTGGFTIFNLAEPEADQVVPMLGLGITKEE